MKKNSETEKKSTVIEARAEDYQSPKVVTMTSAQLLEQVGPAQGYGNCEGGHPHGRGWGRGGRRGR